MLRRSGLPATAVLAVTGLLLVFTPAIALALALRAEDYEALRRDFQQSERLDLLER